MSEHGQRLGDLIDDYCPRCRLLLNHAIASIMQEQVVKVICQTCFTEHAYRRGEGGKKKPGNPRATLFEQVLAKAAPPVAEPLEETASKRKAGRAGRYAARRQASKDSKPAPGAKPPS